MRGKADVATLAARSFVHTQLERKQDFIKALAWYLGNSLAVKSIELEMNKPAARERAKLFQAAGLHGYPTVEEVEKHLHDLLDKE